MKQCKKEWLKADVDVTLDDRSEAYKRVCFRFGFDFLMMLFL